MKKVLSVIVSLVMAAAVIVPVTAADSYAASFSVRTSMPDFDSTAGKTYYYTDNNIFYAAELAPTRQKLKSYNNKYCIGNCTWYAYARASEILGKNINSNFRWSAS